MVEIIRLYLRGMVATLICLAVLVVEEVNTEDGIVVDVVVACFAFKLLDVSANNYCKIAVVNAIMQILLMRLSMMCVVDFVCI